MATDKTAARTMSNRRRAWIAVVTIIDRSTVPTGKIRVLIVRSGPTELIAMSD